MRLSVPKIYEILAEKYVIRSKWHKNQKRGAVPTASGPRAVIHMDTVAFGGVLAFTGIDIYTKEAAVVRRPALTSEDGAAFLQASMAHRFTGHVAVLQPDGGPEFKGAFAQQARAYCDRHRIARPYKKNEQAYIESFNRTLRKECLGWGTYRVEDLPRVIPEVHTFLDRYHYHRPHLGLSPLRPPLQAPSTQEDRLSDIYGEQCAMGCAKESEPKRAVATERKRSKSQTIHMASLHLAWPYFTRTYTCPKNSECGEGHDCLETKNENVPSGL